VNPDAIKTEDTVPSAVTAATIAAAAPPVVLSQEAVQQSLVLQMRLKAITDRLPGLVAEALAIEADPNRSPSPPPKYDSAGKRTNTREMRMREELTEERTNIIESLIKLNPLYQVS
jgi:splicing factor 1